MTRECEVYPFTAHSSRYTVHLYNRTYLFHGADSFLRS